MSLFSVVYKTNQYRRGVCQIETTIPLRRGKPILLKPLIINKERFKPSFEALDGPPRSRFGNHL
jgi:hypothetical protein